MEKLWKSMSLFYTSCGKSSFDLTVDRLDRLLQILIFFDLFRYLFVAVPYRRVVSVTEQLSHLG